MKYRPSKRVIWLVIPLLPLAMLSLALWFGDEPAKVDLATRGSKPPPPRKASLLAPSTWPTKDWLDEGVDEFMTWDYNPWKRQKYGVSTDLGTHLFMLQNSDKPEDKVELERLKKLGREWYERILERSPDLALEPGKEIPGEENGYLRLTQLMKRLNAEGRTDLFGERMPWELTNHLRKQTEMDPAAIKTWVDANRARIDEFRAIGLMPGRSAQGVTPDERAGMNPHFTTEATQALMLDARAAVADGDLARAMESIRAANGLADHLSGNGESTYHETLMGGNLRSQIQRYVISGLLPSLSPGQRDIAAWQELLNPTVRQPSDFARTIRGEWNVTMSRDLLPALSDSVGSPPDADYLAESYTQHYQELARQADGMTLADYANGPQVKTDLGHLSRESREAAQFYGLGNPDLRSAFLRQQEGTGLTLAVFAIMNGQPIPLDPVYGLPYKWDPVKRELSLPDPPTGRIYKPKPVKVPKF